MSFLCSPGLTNVPSSSAQQTVSCYAAPYAQNILARSAALGNASMPAYTGQLTAGASPLQQQSFQGLSNLTVPTSFCTAESNLGNISNLEQNIKYNPTTATNAYQSQTPYQAQNVTSCNFNTTQAQQYMNPYLQASLAPQLQLMNQQYGIQGAAQQGAAASKGAFGGSRCALMQGLNQQNQMLAGNQLVSSGYNQAYKCAESQFNADQARNLTAQQANVQQGEFGTTTGLTNAQNLAQYCQAAQQANIQQGEFGSNLGLQGLQAATQANQALGSVAAQQDAANVANLMAQMSGGAACTALNQGALNANYNQYLQQLQYPQTMLGLQENAFKSVPNQTTNTYGAIPSGLQQASGAVSGLGTLGQGLFGNSGLFGSNGTMSGLAGLFGGNNYNSNSGIGSAYGGSYGANVNPSCVSNLYQNTGSTYACAVANGISAI